MPGSIFAFDERNYQNCQDAYQGPNRQDYYLGDYSIEEGSVIEVRADRRTIGSCSIARLRSRTRLSFRRALAHIRRDGVDVAVLWFVKRGRLHVSHQRGHSIASAGDFVVTLSMTPFTVQCLTDEDSQHEVFHVVVPTHVLRNVVAGSLHTGFCIRAQGREFTVAQRMLHDLFEDPGELADEAAEILMNGALSLLGVALKGHVAGGARQTLADKRLEDILKYIDVHLSNPKLSVATVAEGCGISQRYLSLLLQRHGKSFSTLLWDKRLTAASRWLLQSAGSGRLSISEVAYGVGFKSPAHFSRMFKRVFKQSPREFRVREPAQVRSRVTPVAPAAVDTLQ